MTESTSPRELDDSCGCKAGRVATKYGLSGLDDDLVAYWTGTGEEQYSTRELATHVNQRVLEAALEDAGVAVRDGEVENTYRLLTDDDVTSGTRIQTRNELERDGVPIDDVESDFISHQTVYNHLTNCLDASLEEPDDEERLDRSEEKLGALQNRTAAVTEDTIAQLDRNDVIDINEFDVLVSVTVTCTECQQQYTVRDLLEERGCDCSREY
ncbi:rod-determining factor RdfA [Halosolutus gelatinilyticus]|uniref:rod-determining factor RdfA n=1 Tax=Halosolutus gelatinilyticus TaxID=2931975 RepID=UPI001FF140F0|nr:rod-determining factor RdfA [Halosolutus gelatinilyticus]